MKIGIVTYIKDDNYGEELQAYAMQHYLNAHGYDAEVIDLEKRVKELSTSKDTIIPAIVNRIKVYGWRAPIYIVSKMLSVAEKRRHDKRNGEYKAVFHQQFIDFFNKYTKHSAMYYTLEEIRETNELPYDTYIAGSDQIWNYMHTDFLDVFFLEFAKKYNAKRISYAASISVPRIPEDTKETYKRLVANIEYLSVRELQGAELLKELCHRDAEVVLDPTLLLNKDEWCSLIAQNPLKGERYVVVYTLSGSKYIKKLALRIANDLSCGKIVFIISNEAFVYENGTERQIMVNPSQWVGLMSDAAYVVTDSFHGTAFSINFNRPFTTLVNPASNMNSRVLSILEIMNLKSRIVYDSLDGKYQPSTLTVDFNPVNKTLAEWKEKSLNFITTALNQ